MRVRELELEEAQEAGAAPFGALLRRHRLAAGLTQEALAERAGLGVRTLQGLEQGAHRPQGGTARRLAAALGLAGAAGARFAAAAGPAPGRPRPSRAEGPAGAAAPPVPPARPAGPVTFLFTDLEGSPRLLQAHPAASREAVARLHALLRGAVEARGGVVFEAAGAAVCAAFAQATDAVAAALAGQLALQGLPGLQGLQGADRGAPGAGAPRARMGLHTGEATRQGARYAGAPLYRCARLLATAHGGQVVLSGATAELVQDELPGGRLRDLGAHRLQDLARPERVFQLLDPALPADFPPLRSLDARPHNLPLQLTSFVGRERELGAVAAQLRAHRLLTLTGPGGVGKTRLALQAAADAQEAHPDGVWLAELGGLADPALVPQAVAAAVGVRGEPDRPLLATLTDALRPKRLLLVLDNCEHLLEACARLAEALLRAGPGVRVLATSRAPLGAAGEALSPVPPLGLPPAGDGAPGEPGAPAPALARLAQAEAVRLFADRAAAARPGFAVTAETAAAVARICRRLDGLPLALELAAARVRALAVGDVAALLEDRFRLLTGGSRAAPPRLRTLRAAVDWSHALLTAPERALFARLSVFAGGFSLAAAEAVGAGSPGSPGPGDAGGPAAAGPAGPAVLGRLLGLVDQSLVVAEPLPDGTTRFRLLETLRQYAREALEAGGGAEAARARHAAHYLAAVEAAGVPRLGPAPAAIWRRLGAEPDDLRAALGWLLERGDGAAGLRLALALAPFWNWYSRREGQRWLEALLARGGDAPAALRTRATAAAGHLAFHRGDVDRALALYEAAVALAREQGDRRLLAAALSGLGQALGAAGGPPGRAAALLGESLALRRELGDERGAVGALYALGMLAHFQGEPARAVALVEEGLALARRLGLGAEHFAFGLIRLGFLAYLQGQPDRAEGLARQALALRRDRAQAVGTPTGLPTGLPVCLALLAGVASAQGRAGRAARLFGAAERGAESLHQQVVLRQYGDDYDRAVATARARLGEDAFAAAWAAGRAMALEDAVAYALADAPDAA